MKENVIYSICMLISTIVEVYLVFDFYKAFHAKRNFFRSRGRELALAGGIVGLNTMANLQNSSRLNFIVSCCLFLVVALVLVQGNILLRLFHWLIVIAVCMSAELVFFFLLKVSVKLPTNEIYRNPFAMISSIITIKLIEFVILTIIKQISKIQVRKISLKVFGAFIIIPIATIGLTVLIPYIRVGGDEFTLRDVAMIVLYLILLCGNIILFYVFTKYSQLQEQKMLLEISQAKYDERKNWHDKEESIERNYKEKIHDIKYYLKQIGIYLEEGREEKIREVLDSLQMGIHKEEKNIICANHFLNILLGDFKREAEKEKVVTEVFVEAGFKIEFMREIDITSFLGNLLDNALEAARKCENGKIWIDLYMQNDGNFAVFRIKNTYRGTIIQNGDRFVTTKEEKSIHGIGLRNVNRIIESYSGYIEREYDGKYFETMIVIPKTLS